MEGFGVTKSKLDNGANLGFEQKLWQAADKLRSNMDAAEYKHVVLGLIFLKYISDAFKDHRVMIEREASNPGSEWYVKEPQERYEVMEDRDEYSAANIFWVPKEARWDFLQKNAKQPTIGKVVDNAMDTIEKDNPSLKGVLPKDYARPSLDKARLGELIDLIGTIGLGDSENRSKDVLGRVYEYFLGQFADAEGKKGGQFYTPRSIVKVLVEMIEPYKGRVFDPCCGSGGMFVQSEKFVKAHGGRIGDISIFGQESNSTTWRLCKMNLAIRGIDADIQWGDSFHNDQQKDLKANFILANPPFNDSDWKGELLRDDARWRYGKPPVGNANFAWVQQFIHHLAPNGIAGFVLANASLSTTNLAEAEIRKNVIEADLVDCIVLLPKQLFYNTMIPACLWFISRDKKNQKLRDRSGQTLFIDVRSLGIMIDRRHKELADTDIGRVAETYHRWRSKGDKYHDIPGFCRVAKLEDLRKRDYDLTPVHYIKIELPNRDNEPFEKNMENISLKLNERAKDFSILDAETRNNLKEVGYRAYSDCPFGYASNIALSEFIRNIFNQWFIRFEFPGKGNKPYRSNAGEFVYSEELEQRIPKGWNVLLITQVARIIDCLHIKKPDPIESRNILLQVYNIGDFGLLNLSDIYAVSDEDYRTWTKNILLQEGDCIITNAGLTGAVAQIPHGFNAGIGRNITSLRPHAISASYLVEYLLSDYGKKEIAGNLDVGTIFDSLNVKGIKKMKILVPPNDILEKFEKIARPLRKIMEKNAYENLTLTGRVTRHIEDDDE